MTGYVAAIDQGTTSTRFMILDHGGNIVAVDQKEHQQIYPRPGWVEHDALEIWSRTQAVIRGALSEGHVSLQDIAAIGITNQRETTVVWDKHTGNQSITLLSGRIRGRMSSSTNLDSMVAKTASNLKRACLWQSTFLVPS